MAAGKIRRTSAPCLAGSVGVAVPFSRRAGDLSVGRSNWVKWITSLELVNPAGGGVADRSIGPSLIEID